MRSRLVRRARRRRGALREGGPRRERYCRRPQPSTPRHLRLGLGSRTRSSHRGALHTRRRFPSRHPASNPCRSCWTRPVRPRYRLSSCRPSHLEAQARARCARRPLSLWSIHLRLHHESVEARSDQPARERPSEQSPHTGGSCSSPEKRRALRADRCTRHRLRHARRERLGVAARSSTPSDRRAPTSSE